MRTINDQEVINPESVEDVENILRQHWPDGWIPAKELFERFNINQIDRNHIKSHLGNVDVFKIADMADLIWDNSNYGKADAAN
ncbi:hypothetical protein [Pseudoalteromonas sp. Of7M-16]|uniref:hypothetical protein n=1 Tax=Pseudoalteromonas sp. Of7M-16 TaxID=2917756 RepID=UPI001EF44F44|nr:hypothetical protein [Pseudoalteromonas sp. Of7M-16]MCG7551337.1 hypothetical protein [Pseudoalteromonas sp. Of7M-16]